ncbi:protein phosphatase 2C domain-containing protein [Hymenobacter negativus]|uniref:Protein phosphatase 2C domain-containing protein n=1 Tax=Hymenobacter negativus TaxID=2795026 RepID=A0ABS3QA09_9BACT|nr:protein phosphatase 2C domain-containing protein [Hymenobacter negativus]MBO2008082.1 protein phosphatase 2C domain-containing protein [Hymenobacter negativus]
MKIYSALQIGEYHINHCEDYLFVGDIGDNKVLCAVMDGCTMAIDSYFVSTLVGKILRKIVTEKGYKELYNTEVSLDVDEYLKSILKDLFKELTITKHQLMLDQKELLTTLIILLVDKQTDKGIVMVVGDGLVSINGVVTEFDQDNKPDYLGFYLNEDFDKWYNSQGQKIVFDSVQDISIATDGIFMFSQVKKVGQVSVIDPINFLITDKTNAEKEEMLSMKLKKLEYSCGLRPTDDFAMIRIIA